jgi:hypothetical protein
MSLDGIQVSSSIITGTSKPVDAKYGPFNSVAEAETEITSVLRYQGLTVGIIVGGSIVDYWWKDGIANGQLIEKTTGASGDFVESQDIDNIVQLDNATYNGLSSYDSRTLYVIVG